jgi:hypothetical protein
MCKEPQNVGFTGFSPGGSKGLWFSRASEGDDALVIGEAAIDLLSFAVLHPSMTSRYVITGVVRQLNFTERGARYALATVDENTDYLICEGCGKVEPLETSSPFREL